MKRIVFALAIFLVTASAGVAVHRMGREPSSEPVAPARSEPVVGLDEQIARKLNSMPSARDPFEQRSWGYQPSLRSGGCSGGGCSSCSSR